MNEKNNSWFHAPLLHWYAENKRDLPWRNTTDPYRIWLSEIILQQTRVDQGMSYFLKILEKCPTVHDLASLDDDKLMNLWQGLGYYSRARNLKSTAIYISQERKGEFPENYKELIKLKGVGPYTASAIASFCYNEIKPAVDGNVYRVLSRVFNVATAINSSQGQKEFTALAEQLISQDQPGDFNQAMMELGATVCTPKKPLCIQCPFHEKCDAFNSGKIAERPVKLKKTKIRKRHFHYAIIYKNKTILMKRRSGGDIWQGLYEFPLIEKDTEIYSQASISNEFQKVLGSSSLEYLGSIRLKKHILSHQHIYCIFHEYSSRTGQVLEGDYKRIALSEIDDFPLPRAITKFIEEIDGLPFRKNS